MGEMRDGFCDGMRAGLCEGLRDELRDGLRGGKNLLGTFFTLKKVLHMSFTKKMINSKKSISCLSFRINVRLGKK